MDFVFFSNFSGEALKGKQTAPSHATFLVVEGEVGVGVTMWSLVFNTALVRLYRMFFFYAKTKRFLKVWLILTRLIPLRNINSNLFN